MSRALQRFVLHVDGDSFFAACEIARLPHLKGKPVVVGEDRGIACAMSQEAKKLGITRGMPIFKIHDQLPQVVTLPSHFELYEQYAERLYSLLDSRISVLERYSIDECFGLVEFPASASRHEIESWLQRLKRDVQEAIGITYSFGLARTKALAKIASKHRKPDGCTVLFSEQEKDFLESVPIGAVWGIGWSLSRRFQTLRVKTAREFSEWRADRVERTFALPVQELWKELNGISVFAVCDAYATPKSLQSTKSFSITSNQELVIAELLQNVDIVFSRMRQHGLVTKSISFYVKTPERRYFSDVLAIQYYSDNPLDISEQVARAAQALLKRGLRFRSTGATVWSLRPKDSIEYDFFGYQRALRERSKAVEAIDDIRLRFGHQSIGLLAALPSMLQRNAIAVERQKTDSYVSGLPLPYLGEVQ